MLAGWGFHRLNQINEAQRLTAQNTHLGKASNIQPYKMERLGNFGCHIPINLFPSAKPHTTQTTK
jgi:hypothetical protein